MFYLSKNTILKAYQLLSSIDSDKSQGLTQKVSALKYGTALDRYVKNYGKNCDLKDTGNKTFFTEYVGDVVKINDEICTKDFYTNIALNGRDYDCGSNFFSQSSVKDSKNNTEVTYDYPKRSGWKPMMNVKNQELLYDAEILKSGIAFYLASSKTKLAYAIWLARFLPIDSNDVEGIKTTLSDVYSSVLVDALLQINYSEIDTSYITFEAQKAEINDEDIKSLYDADILVEKNEYKTEDGMFEYEELKIGDKSENGKLFIVDKDRLCYLVKSNNYGAEGTRTISKEILSEFVNYLKEHPNTNAEQARSALSGNSRVDKFEYGYASTILVLAKMVLNGKRRPKKINQPLQQIFYGAPGTGKSYKIKKDVEEAKRIYFRTTFHPDSDYSTFVGCYKPTMKSPERIYTTEELTVKLKEIKNSGTPYPCHKFSAKYWESLKDLSAESIKKILSACGFTETYSVEVSKCIAIGQEYLNHTEDGEIIYSFTPQAFTNAYIKAWQTDEPVFLIIEEINRGNCAQIFGDLFQLLDRDDEGKSQYKVDADKDLADYIREKLGNEHREGTPEYIYEGEEIKLQLPNNLYIWATMNTSDQSLFPIDSAFKRRWEWVYRPIAEGEGKYEIEGQGENSWWKFIQGINEVIDVTTHSEDKKLGYYFCKPAKKDSKIITKKTFVNKVVFYLWNDVFKVYGFKSDIFDKEVSEKDTKKITFKDFYKDDGNVNDDTIKTFVQKVMAKAPKAKTQTDEENQQGEQNDTHTEA